MTFVITSSLIKITTYNSDKTEKDVFEFDFVADVDGFSSPFHLTDTCKVVIPRRLTWQGKDIVAGSDPLIKRGARIEIWLGYNGKLQKRFSGFISKITPKLPIEIECEDEMFLFKQFSFTKSFASVTLSELVDYIFAEGQKKDAFLFDIPVDVNLSTGLGKFRITNATGAQVFEELRSKYNIYSFFREGTLYVGLAYVPALRKEAVFKFEYNILDNHKLEYRRDDDVKIKVKAVSINSKNEKIEIEVGDPDGELRTIHQFNYTEKDLKAWAEREIDRLKYEGYYGDFTTFGEPYVDHGAAAVILDDRLPERKGTYLIKEVKYKFGPGNGYKQTVVLDKKIA